MSGYVLDAKYKKILEEQDEGDAVRILCELHNVIDDLVVALRPHHPPLGCPYRMTVVKDKDTAKTGRKDGFCVMI